MAKDKKGAPKEIKITGIVEELDLEEDDIGLQIVEDDRAYRVAMDKQGRKLLDYVDEEVEATGVVTKSAGVSEIKITRFHVVDEYDGDDDEEAEDYDDDFMSDRNDD
jgi:hypothetical protein